MKEDLRNKKQILEVLEKYKNYVEEQGLKVYAIGLKGSQNYNLDDEDSDIDANLVFIPTLRQLRTNKSYKYEFEEGEVTCHNIYSFASIVAKGNPQWIEVCNTEYVIGDFSLFKHYKLNPSALKGMMLEKDHSFSKLYPSREKYVKEFGYDPKQLHHIIRLYECLSNNTANYKYDEDNRKKMLDIKRGRYPKSLNEAIKLRDTYKQSILDLYDTRKLEYKKQEVDYCLLDDIVIKYLKGE